MVCVLQADREPHAKRLSWLRVESVHQVLREIVLEKIVASVKPPASDSGGQGT